MKYGGRLNVYPLGFFSINNEYVGHDVVREQKPKIMIGAGNIKGCHSKITWSASDNTKSQITSDYGFEHLRNNIWDNSSIIAKGGEETLVIDRDKDSKNEEFEVFEDAEGNDVKMVIHGALEVEGDEYAIMSYADSFSSEFEILFIPFCKINLICKPHPCTQINIENYHLSDKIALYHGDLFAPLPKEKKYDIIIANPPYVSASAMKNLPPEYLSLIHI